MPTNISWSDETWNSWTGCVKVSDGCTNCYAEPIPCKGRLGFWTPKEMD
jgi:protein gp37